MRTVLITGASGFIGRRLASTLDRAGFRVIGTSRSGVRIEGVERTHRLTLTEPLRPILETERVDAIVHCANDSGADEYRVNVEGTSGWIDDGRGAGVDVQIFLSSLSARADAASRYGRAKHEIERRLLEIGGIVFRLGLVVGNGGMFLRMRAAIQRFPLVPLLDNGRAPIHVIGIDTLCDILRDSLAGAARLRGSAWNLQQPHPHELGAVMRSIRRHFGDFCLFVPIPSLPVYWTLTLLERLPLVRLSIDATNLAGYRQQRTSAPRSDFARFGYAEESLTALVIRAADDAGVG